MKRGKQGLKYKRINKIHIIFLKWNWKKGWYPTRLSIRFKRVIKNIRQTNNSWRYLLHPKLYARNVKWPFIKKGKRLRKNGNKFHITNIRKCEWIYFPIKGIELLVRCRNRIPTTAAFKKHTDLHNNAGSELKDRKQSI